MAYRDGQINKLERALIETHRVRPEPSADGVDVTATVMRDIRRLTPDPGRWAPTVILDQLVWRAATITAAVVLVATVFGIGALRTAGETRDALYEDFETAPLFED
jgi:nitroreductase